MKLALFLGLKKDFGPLILLTIKFSLKSLRPMEPKVLNQSGLDDIFMKEGNSAGLLGAIPGL